ncbi:MAG: hypothetical protein Kow0042_14860 [Calditrichia bacterium]
MKIAVIGTINQDLILPFQGASIQSFGGIYYTIAALSQLGHDHYQIYPISFIGSEVYPALINLLNRYPQIRHDGLKPIDQRQHKVILEYISAEERIEKALFNFPPLSWNEIQPFLDFDFYIINMITGWDISLDAFLRLSARHYDRMYLDVHFLVMGTDDLGKRFPRKPDDINQWLTGARFIQMNEREFRIITENKMSEVMFFENTFKPDQVLIITLGNRGAYVIFYKENIIRKKLFLAPKLEAVVDVTGSGDVFGAGFVCEYLKSRDIYKSMEIANRAGAANCLLKGTTEIDRLLSELEKL